MIKLTDKEMYEALDKKGFIDYSLSQYLELLNNEGDQTIAQAQLRKVVEWLDRDCNQHHPIKVKEVHLSPRRFCIHCWESLKEAAGL